MFLMSEVPLYRALGRLSSQQWLFFIYLFSRVDVETVLSKFQNIFGLACCLSSFLSFL